MARNNSSLSLFTMFVNYFLRLGDYFTQVRVESLGEP